MARMKRIALSMLVAYAASMTLYASHKSAEVMLFRRIYGPGFHTYASQSSESYPLMMIAKDYGLDLSPRELWALQIADIQGLLLVPASVSFFLLGLGAVLIPASWRSNLDKD
jgi:hypothetical protein